MREPTEVVVRRAVPEDAAACRAVYAPYVEDTAISFETEPPTVAQMRARIEAGLATHDWQVLEVDGVLRGYAYGGPFRTRSAYRFACEVSVYLEPGLRRTGGGRRLYDALFPHLVERGFLTALAGMTWPNEASEGLRRAVGFETVGTYRRVGWKLGAWHDVLWLQRELAPARGEPREPR